MATLDGDDIFGLEVTMDVSDNPRDQQLNSFPGLNGVESVDLGGRGRFTSVSGRLQGVGPAGLADAENTFRSYKDSGRSYTLVDTLGNVWLYVKVESFEPQGRAMQDDDGYSSRPYTARLRHLV